MHRNDRRSAKSRTLSRKAERARKYATSTTPNKGR